MFSYLDTRVRFPHKQENCSSNIRIRLVDILGGWKVLTNKREKNHKSAYLSYDCPLSRNPERFRARTQIILE